MAFDQGLSGLNAASTMLDVIGNNVGNASTVGFKSATLQFADVFANSAGGDGGASVGLGVAANTTTQQFSQGNITTSTNPLDIAINGNGFFQLANAGETTYTRNGQFHLDATGTLVSADGGKVQGYSANASGVINTGSVGNIVINSAKLPAKATTTVNTALNLDASSLATPPLTVANFNPAQPSSYTYSTATTVYDSQGNSHALDTFFINQGPVGAGSTDSSWAVMATLDGNPLYTAPTPNATLKFTSNGVLDPTSSATLALTVPPGNGAASNQAITVNLANTTQFSASSGVNAQNQDGFASGALTEFSTGPNGVITGVYSNGQTKALGQIVLDNFANPGGLISAGNNQWYAGGTSGTAQTGVPGSNSLGALQSNAVENSNVSLTDNLVNMITAQQIYQANAQSIKTQDQIMQTLASMR